MDLPTDPDFVNESIDECFSRRLTLTAGQKILDPFQMASLSNDFSQLPPFGLMDILIIWLWAKLIMIKASYPPGAHLKSAIYVQMAMFKALE